MLPVRDQARKVALDVVVSTARQPNLVYKIPFSTTELTTLTRNPLCEALQFLPLVPVNFLFRQLEACFDMKHVQHSHDEWLAVDGITQVAFIAEKA